MSIHKLFNAVRHIKVKKKKKMAANANIRQVNSSFSVQSQASLFSFDLQASELNKSS